MPTNKANKTNKAHPADFEQSLANLTQLVEKMEGGKLPLEESLKLFEQGVSLIRHCQTALNQAEQRVQILSSQQQLETYQNENED
ncbi:MAG TPA: exodeoxyribonuclease VII small subunit [Coxiellaceae bacterium]|nr:exodeoxyribonuclease VII small subunit [Coxiellaceae bacterium]